MSVHLSSNSVGSIPWLWSFYVIFIPNIKHRCWWGWKSLLMLVQLWQSGCFRRGSFQAWWRGEDKNCMSKSGTVTLMETAAYGPGCAMWVTESLRSSSEFSWFWVGFPLLVPQGNTECPGDAAELNSAAESSRRRNGNGFFLLGEGGISLLLSNAQDPSSLWLGRWEKIDGVGWLARGEQWGPGFLWALFNELSCPSCVADVSVELDFIGKNTIWEDVWDSVSIACPRAIFFIYVF